MISKDASPSIRRAQSGPTARLEEHLTDATQKLVGRMKVRYFARADMLDAALESLSV